VSYKYSDIAFTANVRDVQGRYGSEQFYTRHSSRGRRSQDPDVLSQGVRDFLSKRDGFYLASVSETGWPYVQYRGGPAGFVRVIDDNTIGWADFRGNLQYISTGNLAGDNRIAMIVMDYPNRRRLKIFGRARVVFADDGPELVASLSDPGYDAVIERAVAVSVDAFDWNCPQHITPRYSAAEIEPLVAPLRHQIMALETENVELRQLLAADE
jgi:uncharacterized protein